MALRPSKLTDGNAFSEFQKNATVHGSKAAGLRLIPAAWCPEFEVLPVKFHDTWKNNRRLDRDLLKKAMAWLDSTGPEKIAVRSSGVGEKIEDRGKFDSVVTTRPRKLSYLAEAIETIFRSAEKIDKDERLGIVIQKYLQPTFSGHLSNEVRLSPTRNQWNYEIERPNWTSSKGLNSKSAPMPESTLPIGCGSSVPHQSLRSVGKWMTENLGPRCHIEWVTAGGFLWLVQLDLEWREQDVGFDPRIKFDSSAFIDPQPDKAKILRPYSIGSQTEWTKLKNLSEFDFDNDNPGPRIYPLTAREFFESLSSPNSRNNICEEIKLVTGDRAVVRTDCKQPGVRQYNLPRTDTESAAGAYDWCRTTLDRLIDDDLQIDHIAFLIHAFLPSEASAWVYASPDDPTVIVDALWGLPDGLQVLPVDTYEVNIPRRKIIGTKSTFKPRFLREKLDGSWVYEDILRSQGRRRVLKQPDILEIAFRTREIANKLGEDAQVMWFCGIPERYGVGRNLPWYRSREHLDTAPRDEGRYKPFKVRNPGDLQRLPERQAMIELAPDVELIRSDEFLQKVIDTALEKRLPVQLHGSRLGHTYYRLSQAGIAIVLTNDPKYHRKRERRTFGKIVRDKVSLNIQSGGETVIEALLEKEDLSHGLTGKMIEELEEFLRAASSEERCAELADVFEVLRGLAKAADIDWQDLLRFADQKRSKNGGFTERKVLLETSLPQKIGPLESTRVIGIDNIGRYESSESVVKIPITSIINSIARSKFVVDMPTVEISLSMEIVGGRLILRPSRFVTTSHDEHQYQLFND